MAVVAPSIAATTVPVLNPTGQYVGVTITGGTVQGILSTPQAISGNGAGLPVVATPAIPSSTVQALNPYPFPVAVLITAGTTTHIAVNGADQATSNATTFTAVVPVSGNIAITYSVVPTSWAWSPLYQGFALSTGLTGSPVNIGLQPGGSITLIYSVVPTSWAWAAPLSAPGDYPWYAAENTVLVSEVLQLPYLAHAALAQTGLAVGVSN